MTMIIQKLVTVVNGDGTVHYRRYIIYLLSCESITTMLVVEVMGAVAVSYTHLTLPTNREV